MDALTLRECTAQDPRVRAVIDAHFALMRSQSPEDSCHVLPADGLQGAFMVSAERNGRIVGIGALTEVEAGHFEIKSMHTTREARGHGVARSVLSGLLEEARRRDAARVSLETGTAAEFTAARGLYASAGFLPCPPFGEYAEDPLSVFMTRAI